jgi:hypothetical protein
VVGRCDAEDSQDRGWNRATCLGTGDREWLLILEWGRIEMPIRTRILPPILSDCKETCSTRAFSLGYSVRRRHGAGPVAAVFSGSSRTSGPRTSKAMDRETPGLTGNRPL